MIHLGDCLDVMRGMEPNSIDAIVTDPPYGLEFMGKQWDRLSGKGRYQKGGVWQDVDGYSPPKYIGGKNAQDWHYAWAVEALRVAKPGCHLLAFGGTRTFHRLACAIEDAGWEIRDTLMWVYGSGFPKSHDVSKAIDKVAGKDRTVIGKNNPKDPRSSGRGGGSGFASKISGVDDRSFNITAPATDAARQWEGWGTALKPAWEPIILARKPLDGTVAANVQKWGTGSINIDGCRVGVEVRGARASNADGITRRNMAFGMKEFGGNPTSGRWPANLIHDGSEEVLELFPSPHGAGSKYAGGKWGNKSNAMFPLQSGARFGDSGSAARFFYCAKASRAEREMGCEGMEARPIAVNTGEAHNVATLGRETRYSNHHPTVKPLALMRYLCRLVTPPNGLILDPFMGSGATGMAAQLEGFGFIGIEKETEYCEIAERRIEATAA